MRFNKRASYCSTVLRLSADQLWQKYGISRISEITNFDTIGIPVWISCRPLSSTVSIHCGKGLDKDKAVAGAIFEAVEFHASEHPEGQYYFGPYAQFKDYPALDWRDCPLARNSIMNDHTPTAWDVMQNIETGADVLVPSSLVWMKERQKEYFSHFQCTSNGTSTGYNITDATIQALYEVIERDAWTIDSWKCEHGQYQRYIDISNYDSEILYRIRNAGLVPVVFDCTSNIGIPSFGCFLLDPVETNGGSYAGHGCHINPIVAMERAILEAVQSRAVYIAGSRDDLFRRSFLVLKSIDQRSILDAYSKIPLQPFSYTAVPELPEEDELQMLLQKLKNQGLTAYSKVLSKEFNVTRVVVPGLEPPVFDAYTPGKRIK